MYAPLRRAIRHRLLGAEERVIIAKEGETYPRLNSFLVELGRRAQEIPKPKKSNHEQIPNSKFQSSQCLFWFYDWFWIWHLCLEVWRLWLRRVREYLMTRLAITATACAFLTFAFNVNAEQATLRMEGIHADADGDAIAKALADVASVKVTTTATKEKPTMVLTFDAKKTDLGDMAQAIAAAKTPNREKGAPTAILVLGYERLDGSAAADEQYLPKKVEAAVAKLKGVDAKECKADTKNKQLLITLDAKGGAKLADIKSGFPGLSLK
jgi:hypothetical protein